MARTTASSHDVERELRGLLRQIAIKNFYETCVPEEASTDSAELNLQIHLTQSCTGAGTSTRARLSS